MPQARFLDFLQVHFYPLESGFYEYAGEEPRRRNLAYLESVVREVAAPGKPVVLAEFGWYDAGRLTIDQGHRDPRAHLAHKLYVLEESQRPTEHGGPRFEPPDWWDRFWQRHFANTGQTPEEAISMLEKLLGRSVSRATETDAEAALKASEDAAKG
jgi:hypothetical protein